MITIPFTMYWGGSGVSIALSLIALALGYKLFVDATKEREGLKVLGQMIGVFIMIVAFLATACAVATKICKGAGYFNCPLLGKAICPVSPGAAGPPASS